MKTVYRRLQSLAGRENGATIIEYALLAALVSIGALAALIALGPALLGLYSAVAAAVTAA